LAIHEQFKKITTFVFDVDGVLTDGTILLLDNGLQARRMNIKDGYALQLAVKKGYRIVVISGGDSPPVTARLEKLGITDVQMSITNKRKCLEDIVNKYSLQSEQILFMGDDIPDLEAMQAVGIAACPADAVNEIRQVSKYVSPYIGGNGCVRDVIEIVLKINEQWNNEAGITSR
jgi:3-deoxy-D-manno-octulosonate 8-phosphate phosphatase (KDO 8-P phosphatase)